MPYANHESHDPTAQRNFNANVAEEEESAEPSHTGRGHGGECFSHAITFGIGSARIRSTEYGTSCGPESPYQRDEFQDSGADLTIRRQYIPIHVTESCEKFELTIR